MSASRSGRLERLRGGVRQGRVLPDDASQSHPSEKRDVYNALVAGGREFINSSMLSEDEKKLQLINGIVNNRIKVQESPS
jgi:hypothetical protein